MDKQDLFTQLCCINCQKLSENPQVTSCCNSVVCSDCKSLVQVNICQVCSSRNYQILNNSFLSKLSSQVKVPCKHGCGYDDSIKQIKDHESKCPLKNYQCKLCQFSSSGDEFLCHLNNKHSSEIMVAFSQGEDNKKEALAVDPNLTQLNRLNFPARPGSTGKYYCGQDIGFKCGCCSGCGPTNGDNCLPCMILDVRIRNLPKGYLVNKYGATSIVKDNLFSCGRLINNRSRCGENRYWCDGCDSLTRNAKNYFDAFSK